jgi:hypothetical protein
MIAGRAATVLIRRETTQNGWAGAWERSCRGWLSVMGRIESAECLRE